MRSLKIKIEYAQRSEPHSENGRRKRRKKNNVRIIFHGKNYFGFNEKISSSSFSSSSPFFSSFAFCNWEEKKEEEDGITRYLLMRLTH